MASQVAQLGGVKWLDAAAASHLELAVAESEMAAVHDRTNVVLGLVAHALVPMGQCVQVGDTDVDIVG